MRKPTISFTSPYETYTPQKLIELLSILAEYLSVPLHSQLLPLYKAFPNIKYPKNIKRMIFETCQLFVIVKGTLNAKPNDFCKWQMVNLCDASTWHTSSALKIAKSSKCIFSAFPRTDFSKSSAFPSFRCVCLAIVYRVSCKMSFSL